ncbi:hypothetical protein RclHR1_05430012 [Rhizophagus clarus]|uniref:Uncharacterized protein n=1 Tax=Rhizophagus clarus TaxID=94130 RepID=A0A2Z6S5M1_9GLOM|nr:hypothetical protein RclHR1_05430012 [Rhizophagus clarus]
MPKLITAYFYRRNAETVINSRRRAPDVLLYTNWTLMKGTPDVLVYTNRSLKRYCRTNYTNWSLSERKIHEQIFLPIPRKEYKNHLVYSNENYDKEFQWPSKTYDLKKSEINEIKSYLSVIDNKAAEMKLSDFETRGLKFGRLITSDRQTRIEVDRWAHI